jgi:hypothetical protein
METDIEMNVYLLDGLTNFVFLVQFGLPR